MLDVDQVPGYTTSMSDAPAPEMMWIDWFHRTEKSKSFTKEAPADSAWRFQVPKGSTLEQILKHGYEVERLPKGSARGGCFEIQTDEGIWSSPTNSRLNPSTAIFKTWDELEAEEAKENSNG